MKKFLKNKHFSLTAAMTAVLVLLLGVLFTLVIPAYRNAYLSGYELGEETGHTVGKYTGSAAGMNEGLEASKKRLLSASEIAAKLSDIMKNTGEIQLLSVSVDSGFSENSSEATAVSKNTAVYYLDFNEVAVSVSGEKSVFITVPEPEVRIFDNETNTEIANGKEEIPPSYEKQARELALSYTEKTAGLVCGDMCAFSVSLKKQERSSADE